MANRSEVVTTRGATCLDNALCVIAGATGWREVDRVVAATKAERDYVVYDCSGRDVTESAAIAAQWFGVENGEALSAV